jgi:hypothetical protein
MCLKYQTPNYKMIIVIFTIHLVNKCNNVHNLFISELDNEIIQSIFSINN